MDGDAANTTRPERQVTLGTPAFQAANPAANLLASTRLSAPLKVGFSPNVEGKILAVGSSRRTLWSMASVNAPSTSSQARAISPLTTTASGLKPTTRFEIPTPRQSAVSISGRNLRRHTARHDRNDASATVE